MIVKKKTSVKENCEVKQKKVLRNKRTLFFPKKKEKQQITKKETKKTPLC